MKIRSIDNNDYNMICEWWIARDMIPVPKQSLPLTGYIVVDDEHQYCAGFLYKTDSDMALLEGFISNKNTEYAIRDKALDLLIEGLLAEAKRDGYRMVLAQTTHKNIIRKCEQFNFIKLTQPCVNYVKEVR